jgi:phosphoribosylamine---glycine ligase
VVIAAAGYPAAPRTGEVITGSEQDGVLHAGTRRREDGAVVSSGGRVLAVTATGPTLTDARAKAYALADTVNLPHAQRRSDIALRAVRGTITV